MAQQKMSAHMPAGQDEWAAPEPTDEENLSDALEGFVGKLEAEAKRRVDRRVHVEQRWLEDLRQYHGRYKEEVERELSNITGSKVFMNVTRAKTNRFISKLWDLLFPTEDKNWSIDPTPVPELAEKAEEATSTVNDAQLAFDAKGEEVAEFEGRNDETNAQMAAEEMVQLEQDVIGAQAAADQLLAIVAEARRSADLMSAEIDDQLKEARYNAANRDMIEDAAKIGTGILKGPVLGERFRQRWVEIDDGQGGTMYQLEVDNASRVPEVQRVDPWNFFPDPDYVKPEDGNGTFERELMNAKKLRRLAKMQDVNEDAIREILRQDPQDSAPSYLTELTSLTQQDSNSTVPQYHVWEYTGPVDNEDIETLSMALEDEDMAAYLGENEIDPLMEMHVKIWFCQRKILKFALHPLDSNETIYSVFCPEKDESSPFGFGIPYMLRDPQAVLNASWRKLMDNSGYAVGSQIVVNKGMVKPEDGNYELSAGKVWTWTSNDLASSGQPPFAIYDIPSHITELQSMIEMARNEINEIIDIVSSTQESEMGPMSQMSGVGIALLLNASNVVYRRAVKNYDDDVSVPMIRRFYHWNMQFSPKKEIKGDFEVDARGSSVLLVREMMAQNLMTIIAQFGDHPRFGDWLKDKEMLDALFRAIMIPAREIVRSESEYKAHMAEKSKNAPPDPKVMMVEMQAQQKDKDREVRSEEIAAKLAIAEMESASRLRVAELSFEEEMVKLAEAMNMDMEKVRAGLQAAREKIQANRETEAMTLAAKERALATEVAMAQRTGKSAGGSV